MGGIGIAHHFADLADFLPGHPDVRKEDIRLFLPDQVVAGLGVKGRAHHLAVVILPLDDPFQTLQNDSLIINQNNTVRFSLPSSIEL